MNIEIARDRLQQVAEAAIAGNRLMARLELEAAMEFTAESPEAWCWQAWTAGSPQEAKDALLQALSLCPDHPLGKAGLAWIVGLEELAAETIEEDGGSDEGSLIGLPEDAERPAEEAVEELEQRASGGFPQVPPQTDPTASAAVADVPAAPLPRPRRDDMWGDMRPIDTLPIDTLPIDTLPIDMRRAGNAAPSPPVAPRSSGDPETALLAALTAIHDEVFATLYQPGSGDLDSSGLHVPAVLLRPEVLGDSCNSRR